MLTHSLFKVSSSFWEKLGQFSAVALAFVIPISTSMTSVFAWIILLSFLFGENKTLKKEIFFHHPLVKWIYPLIILMGIGITYSIANMDEVRDRMMDALRLAWIPLLIYFYQTKKIAKWALWAFVAAMLLTLVLAFLKIYADVPVGLKFPGGAIFKSHIKTSFFMAMAAFFLAQQIKETARRYAAGYIILICLMIYYLLFMSTGRVGYLSLIVCLVLFAWQNFRLKGIMAASVVGMSLIVGAYFTSDVFSARVNVLSRDWDFYQKGRLMESSLGSRISFAESSAHLFVKHPWFGWGTGSYGKAYEKHHEGEKIIFTDNPHNEYLRTAVELGMLGLGLLFMFFYHQWRLSKQLPLETRRFYQGVLLTFMMGCFINSWLTDFTEGYFYCVITAICFASLPPKENTNQLRQSVLH